MKDIKVEVERPICKHCKEKMFNAEFLMMGVKYMCHECKRVMTIDKWKEWEARRNRRKKKETSNA